MLARSGNAAKYSSELGALRSICTIFAALQIKKDMTMRKRAILILAVAACAWHMGAAASDADKVAGLYYAQSLQGIQQKFKESAGANGVFPDRYALTDIDGDGWSEIWLRSYNGEHESLMTKASGRLTEVFSNGGYRLENGLFVLGKQQDGGETCEFLSLADGKLQKKDFTRHTAADGSVTYFDSKGKKMKDKKVKNLLKELKKQSKSDVSSDGLVWLPVDQLGHYVTAESGDITLKEAPLFSKAILEKNLFVSTKGGDDAQSGDYDRLVFKSNYMDVKPAAAVDGKATYSLVDKNDIKNKFKGYRTGETFPIIVKKSFEATHRTLRYSRWKKPEPIQTMDGVKLDMLTRYFGGKRIEQTRWLAHIDESGHDFYSVVFAKDGNTAHVALVSFARGMVAAVWNHYWQSAGTDVQDYMEHIPEIQCIMDTDEGLELYIRQADDDGSHFVILREVGQGFLELMNVKSDVN